MKLIKPYVKLLSQGPGLQGIYNQIESAGRTCYKSEVRGGESAKTFVNNLIMNGHTAMLEFGTVYLVFPIISYSYEYKDVNMYNGALKYKTNPYSKVFIDKQDSKVYVTTNYRVIIENEWKDDLKYLCYEPTEFHYKRYTAKFVISIGIGREFLRHRKFNFANESTRFVNYSKDRVGNQCTFIIPSWSNINEGEYSAPLKADNVDEKEFIFGYQCYEAEKFYMDMLAAKAAPQQAREVLPLCTKSELCMCGFEEDWRHFFNLRMRGTTGNPHPDAKYIATEWWKLLKEQLNVEL
jgi:thymidylate synthase (FAD)